MGMDDVGKSVSAYVFLHHQHHCFYPSLVVELREPREASRIEGAGLNSVVFLPMDAERSGQIVLGHVGDAELDTRQNPHLMSAASQSLGLIEAEGTSTREEY